MLRNGAMWRGLLLTVIGFAGVFTLYTYIEPLLTQITGMDNRMIAFTLLLFGAGLALGTAAVKGLWLGPAFVDGLFHRNRHSLGLVARQLQHRCDDRGVRTFAFQQGTEDGVENVGHFAQEGLGQRGWLGGGELQYHPQVVG